MPGMALLSGLCPKRSYPISPEFIAISILFIVYVTIIIDFPTAVC